MKKSVENKVGEYMKCPGCGQELTGGSRCVYCGKAAPSSEQDIQVEYKEFPVSEYLEIRKKFKPAFEDENASESPLSGKNKSANSKSTGRRKETGIQDIKKRIAIVVIAVLITFLSITGLFYWLRIIIKSLF